MGAFVFHICLGKYLAKPVAKTGLFIKKVIFLLFSPFMKIYRKTVELYEKLAFKIKAFTQERKQKQREKKKTEKETAKKGRKKCTPKTKKQKNIRFQ